MAKILLINGHQKTPVAGGRLNKSLMLRADGYFRKKGDEIKATVIDAGYSIPEEVEKLAWADVVVFFTPVYWMSVPWAFKRYIDEVYMAGHGKLSNGDGRSRSSPEKGYGTGGCLKSRYLLVTTWNAPRGAFCDKTQFFEGKSVDDVFFDFHKAQQFLGMRKLESFSCHDVMKNPRAEDDLRGFERHLGRVLP